MSEIAIDTVGLTKVFEDKTVVDKVSLRVEKGSVFGFLGSNGSGKTTTIRMICGLLSPTSGTGQCLGYDILTQSDQIKLKTGYMPQRFSLYVGLTVYENLRFFADVYQIQNSKLCIQEMMDELKLQPYKNIRAGALSGGWKQTLALACTLLNKPELIFLDEPTSGVDPKSRKDFWAYLYTIAARDKTTVLVTTHYMDEAEKCTHLAYINYGHLLYSGPTNLLLPFSKARTFLAEGNRKTLMDLSEKIAAAYPSLLLTTVNNALRISSRNEALLSEFIRDNKKYGLKEVVPSFEEVFIELME